MKVRINQLLANKPVGETVTINGWVRTRRDTGAFSFVEVNDGSCLANLQIIADAALANYEHEIRLLATGSSIQVTGLLRESPGKGQDVELQASSLALLGPADPESYPLQKKRHSLEFLRELTHLRPRTNALGAVARVRSRLSFAVHRFFQERGFVQIHTPIITTSDCEGAGEMFQVITGRETSVGDHFFGRPAGLTVSGQLQAEAFALALGNVYTFGPTFRAENSNTSRHLAEFWMIEPEMAFCDLAGNRQLAEEMLRYLVNEALTSCSDDLLLFDQFIEKGLLKRLQGVVAQEFVQISYSEAVERLQKSGRQFTYPVSWGLDLQSEHERYLCEEVFACPLTVTDYPASLKPFYMRLNDDGKTVAAMDLLVPGIGEIVGGSQREERYDLLAGRMSAAGIDLDDYSWYLDLRRYGSAPHSGFGLGFERLVQFVTGMGNIREVIAFPRAPGYAPC